MKLKIIKTKKEYESLLNWLDEQFDKKVPKNSPEGEEVKLALLLIKHYEDENYLVPVPDLPEAIKIKMAEKGLKNKDLVGIVGSKGYVSSLLSGKKPLTLEIAKIFHQQLGIPAEVLLG